MRDKSRLMKSERRFGVIGGALVATMTLAIGTLGCASAVKPCPETPAAPSSTPTQAAAAPSGPDPALAQMTDEQVVRRVLDLTGASRLGKQVADGMLANLRKMPDLPPAFVDRFQSNIHADELVDLLVPIYLKHYDRQTLLATIAFYESDGGRALVKELPAVTAESMEVGRTWGTALAKKTLSDLGINPPAKP
jgi:hypothetical protein